mmetsp:Transcript_32881/g.50276  ORF Transcript_32881/g.50276 Transcript_32881/m.50276 type:complete len:184 (+) Transcript_32881:672-1223(+)
MKQLFKTGKIKREVFSISYKPGNTFYSKILFGGVNLQALAKSGHTPTYHKAKPSHSSWTLKLEQFGTADAEALVQKYSADNLTFSDFVFDTGVDGLHVNYNHKTLVEFHLAASTGVSWDLSKPETPKKCTASHWQKFPDIYFKFDGHRYWISRDLVFNRRGVWCTTNLFTTGSPHWAAGLTWF